MTLRAILLAFIGLLAAPSAFADTFTFTAAGANFAASGTLSGTRDPYNSTAFDIQSGTATINGAAYTLYTPSGNSNNPQTVTFPGVPDGGYNYDDVLYTTGTALDFYGLLFAGAANHSGTQPRPDRRCPLPTLSRQKTISTPKNTSAKHHLKA